MSTALNAAEYIKTHMRVFSCRRKFGTQDAWQRDCAIECVKILWTEIRSGAQYASELMVHCGLQGRRRGWPYWTRVRTSDAELAGPVCVKVWWIAADVVRYTTTERHGLAAARRPRLRLSDRWLDYTMAMIIVDPSTRPVHVRVGRTVQSGFIVRPDTASDAHARLPWWLMMHNGRLLQRHQHQQLV